MVASSVPAALQDGTADVGAYTIRYIAVEPDNEQHQLQVGTPSELSVYP